MERKIMSLGRSSLVISLPKNWIQLNSLNKGDVVSFAIQRDRSLVVSPSPEKKRRHNEITVRIETSEDATLLIRKIIACYLNGYFGIRLVSDSVFSVPQRNAIRNVAGKLYMRIMDSDAQTVYLETLGADETAASLQLAIKRIQTICLSMCNDALKSLKTRDIKLAKSVFSLDDDVDHFSFSILRLLRNAAQDPALASELGMDPVDCMDHQTLVYMVEHAADYSADIARHVIMLGENQQEIREDILTFMFTAGTEAVDLYAKAVDAFVSKTGSAAFSVNILEQQRRIEKLDQEIASKAFMGNQKSALLVFAICSIRDNIRRIADCAADIAETAVNHAFKAEI
jgi:phosphate uptake regulator